MLTIGHGAHERRLMLTIGHGAHERRLMLTIGHMMLMSAEANGVYRSFNYTLWLLVKTNVILVIEHYSHIKTVFP